MTTERVSGLSGSGERIEGAGAVTDGQGAELLGAELAGAELPAEEWAGVELSGAETAVAAVRVMPLWARPLGEPDEPGWSMVARRPATARSLEGVGV
ncbi:hypothetical protein [Streptomyces justiciae]|uniref:Uncharacterized protein n=1 Tax=Streptomyces justiciae TaxID=2780140 RepID=A0ABU3LNE3_9ACTN|nr:hypothetical protein [Streptomyces justiciae]MDT7840715.1 hypothetical protein [Streptomyces justiciae]